MVQLNTSNNNNIPIILTSKESFKVEPDWIGERDEVTDSYKRFYSQVARRIGKRGYAYLSIERLAKDLRLCDKTIRNHIRTSRELNLMDITTTGRALRFVIIWHSWMPITQDQALKLKISLPVKFSSETGKIFQGQSPQPKENQVNSNDSKNVETIFKQPTKEIRSMHASEFANYSNNTDSKTVEEKETLSQIVTANTTTTVSSKDPKENSTEQSKSIYTLEIILKWVFAYAMSKLGTRDEIDCHQAFATYCLNTGEKDPWIAEFIKNGYVLSLVNPLKNEQVEQAQQRQAKKLSPKQARQAKQQTTETEEIKGKYPYQVYLDFVNYEVKQGKEIYSVEKLADYLYRTGTQDETQVKQYVELMKSTYAGGKAPGADMHTIEVNTATKTNNIASSPSIVKDLETLQRFTAIESLVTTAWQTLTSQEKEQLINQTSSNLLEKEPQIYSQMPKQALNLHVKGLVKHRLGEMLYKANLNNKANVSDVDVLECLSAIGRERFESLEDYEQAELKEAKIDKIDCFYSVSSGVQGALLEEISKQIYLELGVNDLTAFSWQK